MKASPMILFVLMLSAGLRADEGMWTFDNPPLAAMSSKYGFTPDEKWLEHVRLAALEFGSASAAFISKDGLVLTNHHVGLDYIGKVSEPGANDYAKNGFVAKKRSDEIKIPDLAIRTLVKTINVTDKVNAVVKSGMDEKQAMTARMEKLIKLRDDLDQRDGLRARYVSLYKGGEYWLYAYKVHRDVRLVMAPESQIAFFGGDTDNFMFPRHDLDFALFRVYEGGEPYHPQHYLTWAREGLKAGDLTVVVGRPGRTRRLETVAQMKYQRDTVYPSELASLEDQRQALSEYGQSSPEHARKVTSEIFYVENNLKRTKGYLAGLKDAPAFSGLEGKEADLRASVAKDPKLQAEAGASWARIEEAVEQTRPLEEVSALVNSRNSKLLQTALDLIRCVRELERPAAERLEDYRSDDDVWYAKWCLKRFIPFEDLEMEAFLIQKSLEDIQKLLGPEHPFRKAVLGDRNPADLAKEIMTGTKLQMMYIRTDLLQRGSKGLAKSQDPLVKLACSIETFARELDQKREGLRAIMDDHSGRIARARFALYGKTLYPDATGSLRLSFGPVEGYLERGAMVQPFTTFSDLYERALRQGPEAGNGAWALPARWTERKEQLDLKTPLNFCHKADIIGGNSGSPVITTKGELVGLIFDGNIQSLPGSFYYDESMNRAISLDGRAIIEALMKVYDARHIVDEILPR